MGKYDDLAAVADGLDAAARTKSRAAEDMARAYEDMTRTAEDMASVAAIARKMHQALADNTEEMRDMSVAVRGAADRCEDASRAVFTAVEEQAVKTLQDVDLAARTAVENSRRSAESAVRELEGARTAMIATTAVVCGVAVAACLIVLLIAVGALWLQFRAGAEWLSSWGWIALPAAMLACAALGWALCSSRS